MQHRLPCLGRRVGVAVHGVLALLGVALGAVGLWAGCWGRGGGGEDWSALHLLHSPHTWLGLLSLLLAVAQLLIGQKHKLPNDSCKVKKNWKCRHL